MEWVHRMIAGHGLAADTDVIEVGSYDVNGSVRPLFSGARSYLGVDIRPGPGVDVVADIDATESLPVDVVVSTEMLEHTPRPWVSVDKMARMLRPGGHLVLTTRAPGFGVHDYPGDFYRFTPSAIRVLVEDAGLVVDDLRDDPDPESPGVFVLGHKGLPG